MLHRATVVLDVGKTLTKLSLWGPEGRLQERRSQPNERVPGAYLGLDALGIEDFLEHTLRDFGRRADIGAVIPVAHGAAAAWLGPRGLVQPPLDYEQVLPPALRRDYDAQRDPFAQTGSPALPNGLNLGAQLHYLDALRGTPPPDSVCWVPWAQYWSWRLSGVASADLTHLGCHTDLWYPMAGTPSGLASRRGWAERMAPLAFSGATVGHLTSGWVRRTGLASDAEVLCGIHDSNAALLAARAFPELRDREATVLSTGTWFVAMRSPAAEVCFDIADLDEARDCLVNIDAFGRPVPSARWMGGREIELLGGAGARIDAPERQETLLRAVEAVVRRGAMILPGFVPGSGPYPMAQGRWMAAPTDEDERLAAVCLYAALLADVSLDLIGARERLLVEGRFSRCTLLVGALACLRPGTTVYVAPTESEVAFGALCLRDPAAMPVSSLSTVPPLPVDLAAYRGRWRQEAGCAAR